MDCRPADQYNSGHLPTAFHLDANLVREKQQLINFQCIATLIPRISVHPATLGGQENERHWERGCTCT